MTLEEVILLQREIRTRLDDHVAQCARDKLEMKNRIDGAYARLWAAAAGAVMLLLAGLATAIGLLLKHMMDTH